MQKHDQQVQEWKENTAELQNSIDQMKQTITTKGASIVELQNNLDKHTNEYELKDKMTQKEIENYESKLSTLNQQKEQLNEKYNSEKNAHNNLEILKNKNELQITKLDR
eukprot:UN18184